MLEYKGPLDSMSISFDERYIACGAQDSTLVMWPLSTLLKQKHHQDHHHQQQTVESSSTAGGGATTEAEAALLGGAALFFSGGCYERKVIPVNWSMSNVCASAGGNNIVLWNLGKKQRSQITIHSTIL